MKLVALLILCVIVCATKAQDTLPVHTKQVSRSRLIDCFPAKDYLVAIAADSSVYQIRLRDFTIKEYARFEIKATAIGKDRNGMIWVADPYQSLFSLRDTGWKRERNISGKIYALVFDSHNDLFLITSLGIYNSKTEMFYNTNNYRNAYFRLGAHMHKPVHFYIDNADNIWMHWISRSGGEMQVFSTKSNTYSTTEKRDIKRAISFRRYSSIFGTGSTIFLAQSDIFGMGDIFSYRGETLRRLLHTEYDTVTVGLPADKEEYLGAAFFNEADHSIYYFSARGLFKAKYNAAMDTVDKPQRIMPPQYSWRNNIPNPVEFAMDVSKLLIHDGIIIYVNQDTGIFIFKDNKLYNLR